MEEKGKKVLGLVLLGLFVGSFLIMSIGVVSAALNVESMAGAFSSFFSSSGWTEGQVSASVTKIIFFVIISLFIYLIIYGVTNKHNGIVLLLSFLIGFLATAYITPSEVFSLINSYTALGLTLATLIPLAVLGFITYLATTKGNPAFVMLQYVAWILFACYSTYRLILFWGEGSSYVNAILLGTALVSTGFALFNHALRKIIVKNYIETTDDKTKQEIAMAALGFKNAADFERMLAGEKKPG